MKTRSGTRIVHIKLMVVSNPVSVGYTIYDFSLYIYYSNKTVYNFRLLSCVNFERKRVTVSLGGIQRISN